MNASSSKQAEKVGGTNRGKSTPVVASHVNVKGSVLEEERKSNGQHVSDSKSKQFHHPAMVGDPKSLNQVGMIIPANAVSSYNLPLRDGG